MTHTATQTTGYDFTGPARTVHVVSWVYWNGDNQGGGGFDWYEDEHRTAADAQFEKEKADWYSGRDGFPNTRIRLVTVNVPAHLYGQALTDFLDANIDPIKALLPARKVALV